MSANTTTFNTETFNSSEVENIQGLVISHYLESTAVHVSIMDDNNQRVEPNMIKEIDPNTVAVAVNYTGGEWTVSVSRERKQIPEDKKHGWSNKYDADRQSNLENVGSIWSASQEDLHIEPLKKLVDLTRPAATDVQMYGYGGMIWESQDEFDDPTDPPEDNYHGWGARWDGDIEETEYAMEELDDFWVNY